MTKKTVADALHVFYELNSTFADAYWETNDINQKDRFFAMKSMLQDELDELHKLSVQDHIYPYESIDPGVLQLRDELRDLLPDMKRVVLRPKTIKRFLDLIPSACELFDL